MDPPKASASSGSGHHLGYPAGAERAMRSLDPYEYRPPMGSCRTPAVQVSSDRFTDIPRQGEAFSTIGFTSDDDLASTPIDIVDRKLGDFGRPQAETDQHGQDRKVAAAVLSAAVAGRQQAPDVVRLQSLGQSNQSPTGDRRHGRGKRSLHFALDMKKAEQGS
jgi:hypothetical protein